jgi:hypothetical protein
VAFQPGYGIDRDLLHRTPTSATVTFCFAFRFMSEAGRLNR